MNSGNVSDLRLVTQLKKTAYCVVHEGAYSVRGADGVTARCAVKQALSEDPDTLVKLKEEFGRLSLLSEIGQEPALVPRPLYVGPFEQTTVLVMEWVGGQSLARQISRGKPNPKSAAYVVESLSRLVSLLCHVQAPSPTGLRATMPDFKRDSIILTDAGVRVLDWNVLHDYALSDAVRDLKSVAHFCAELAVGSKLGSFAAAQSAVEQRLGGSIDQRVMGLLLRFLFKLAAHPSTEAELSHVYEILRDLGGEYAAALRELHWLNLGIGASDQIGQRLTQAADAAEHQLHAGQPPHLGWTAQTLEPADLKSSDSAGKGTHASRVSELLAAGVAAGWIKPTDVRPTATTHGVPPAAQSEETLAGRNANSNWVTAAAARTGTRAKNQLSLVAGVLSPEQIRQLRWLFTLWNARRTPGSPQMRPQERQAAEQLLKTIQKHGLQDAVPTLTQIVESLRPQGS